MIVRKYISKKDTIATIKKFFGNAVEDTPTEMIPEGEAYILKYVDPLLKRNKALNKMIKDLPTSVFKGHISRDEALTTVFSFYQSEIDDTMDPKEQVILTKEWKGLNKAIERMPVKEKEIR